MLLSHLPDFQRPLREGDLEVYPPFEPGRPHAVPPERLEVATLVEGRPDFSLELVRGASPALPPAPYGVLDFRVRARHRLDEALALARANNPAARIEPAVLDGGFLRLRPLGGVHDVPEELLQPVPLAWNGLGMGRLVLRLAADGAALIERSLRGEILPLAATAEVEWTGVSPRLPVQVRFDPARLLDELRAEAGGGLVSRSALTAFFRRDPAALPLELTGEAEREVLAEALADRVRVRFGRFVPAPGEPEDGWIALADAGTGTFLWDLNEPLAAPRPRLLALEPLRAARDVVAAQGLDAVVRRTVVPPIPTGMFEVAVTANLPAEREVLALGATLRVPPRPPARPQAVEATVDLLPPGDAATVRLRLSPAEPLEYTWSTFAVVEDEAGIERLETPETAHAGPRLHLGPEDFPIDLVPVSASANLLDLADVRGLCRRPANDAGIGGGERAFELRPGRPAVALALPRGTAKAELEIEAVPRDGGGRLRLGPWPAAPLDLGLHSFREYGPQTVEVRAAFPPQSPPGGGRLLAVDLLPEDRPESETTVLFLTPERPSKPWTYLARSPFRAGYRFRPHPDGAAEPAPWSEPRSPFEPLDPGGSPMTEITLGGLRAVPHADDPAFFVYDPGEPGPERGPQGHPVFQLLRAGSLAFLQMAVRWGPGAEALEALREEIARRTGRSPAAVQLTPLPATVESVRLELADGGGNFQELARSSSSGAPPYSALFNLRLDPAQTARAAEAAAGKEGVMRVTYRLSLPRSPQASERTTDVARWFQANSSPAR